MNRLGNDNETSKIRSEGFVQLSHQLIDLCLQLRKLPWLVFFLEFFACADHAQEQTEVDSLLGGGKGTFPGFDLHVIEVYQFFYFQTHGVADVGLHGFSFGIDVGNHDDVLIGHFPESFLLLLNHLVSGQIDLGPLRKPPPLSLTHRNITYLNIFQIDMYGAVSHQEHASKDLFYPRETMGTTIMALKYQGGVIACADSRTSAGGVYTVDRVADKIDFIHDHIICLRSGLAGQSQQAVHKVRHLIDSHVNEQGKLPHVRTAARMVQKMNYEKGLQTGYIVAGWDPYDGAQVYSVNLGGATLLRPYAMGGSGSGFIYGYVDANFKEGMSFQEAKAFCINAVSLAMKRDGSSGGIIRISNITERGLEKEYHTYESLPYHST